LRTNWLFIASLFLALASSFLSKADANPVIDKQGDWKYIRYDDDSPWKIRCKYYIPDYETKNKTRLIQAGISMEAIEALVKERFRMHAKAWNQKREYRLESCEKPAVCAPRSSSDAELDNFSLTCQKRSLDDEKHAKIARLKQKIETYSAQVIGEEKQSLARKKAAGQRASELHARWKEKATPLMNEYAAFGGKFATSYAPTYTTVSKAFSEWAKMALAQDWRRLVVFKVDLDTTIRQETFVTSQYAYRASDLLKTIERACNAMRVDAAPYQGDFDVAGLSVVPPSPLCETAMRDLPRIRDYANKRSTTLSTAAKQLQFSLAELISAKQTAEVDAELRQSRQMAADLTASAAFLAQVNDAVEGIRREDAPLDPAVKVPLLTPRLQRLRVFQTYIVECQSEPRPAWKGTGCLRIASNTPPASQVETNILPMSVSLGLQRLEEIRPALFETEGRSIRALLKKGEIAKAVAAHDALVRGFEVLP
jgi:hypothetical protein